MSRLKCLQKENRLVRSHSTVYFGFLDVAAVSTMRSRFGRVQ
jgi:hypothetical protein